MTEAKRDRSHHSLRAVPVPRAATVESKRSQDDASGLSTMTRSVMVHEVVVGRVVPFVSSRSCILPVSLSLLTGCDAQSIPNDQLGNSVVLQARSQVLVAATNSRTA